MRKQLHAIVEFTSNNLSAYLVEVDGIVGVGKNIDEVKESLRQSITFVIEDAEEDGYDVPDELNGEYEIQYKYDMRSFLQAYGEVLSKSGLESISGINQKQLWHYASGRSKPRKQTVIKLSDSIHQLGKELLEAQFV